MQPAGQKYSFVGYGSLWFSIAFMNWFYKEKKHFSFPENDKYFKRY